jgi:hypothetical protein
MTTVLFKKCKVCLNEKPLIKFEKTSKGYRLNTCSACRSKIKKQKNPEKTKIYQKKSDQKRMNSKKRKSQILSYKRNNPDISRSSAHKRRVAKYGVGHKPYSTKDIVNFYGTKCYLCSDEIDFNAKRTPGSLGWQVSFWVEHFIDIALGGEDNLNNVRPSHAWCNLHKKDFISGSIVKNPFILL